MLADTCLDGSKRAQRWSTSPDTGSDIVPTCCRITTAGRNTGAFSNSTGAHRHRHSTSTFGLSTNIDRYSAAIQRHCTGVDRGCTGAHRSRTGADRGYTGADRHRTCAHHHGNGASRQGDGTRRDSARCGDDHRARDQEKKQSARMTRQQELEKSIDTGTVPARYRNSVPKEYQQYIPFAK